MNILYIHTHDSGRIMSPYGYSAPTPNLMEFAEDATLFRQAYCVSPTCSPSRAGLLTGTYPHQNGMLGLAQRGFSLDVGKHLTGYLGRQGYHTLLCGIQHEYGWYLDHGAGAKALGYDEDITCNNSGYTQEDMVDWDKENAHAVAHWLDYRREKQPFFLSYGMYATHRRYPSRADPSFNPNLLLPPAPIPDSPETREDYALYLTSLMSADNCFGTVLEALHRNGFYEDTLILFTTDHGLANPYSKCTLFDSGVAVALMMRLPGSRACGKCVEGLVSHIDVFPTICDLLKLPKPDYLEGKSFSDCFADPTAPTRKAVFGEVNFHTSYEPIRSVRTDRYKYIRYFDTDYLKINLSNIDESPNKDYLMSRGLSEQVKYAEAVYDLVYDPEERCNLVNNPDYCSIRNEMVELLEDWMKQTNDPLLAGEIRRQPHWKVNKRQCRYASSKNSDDYEALI